MTEFSQGKIREGRIKFRSEFMMRRFVPLLACVALTVVPRAPLSAQGRGGAPVLFEPFDWGPNSAWRRRAAQVRDLRTLLLRQGDLQSLNGVRGGGTPGRPFVLGSLPTTAVTGAFHVPVIALAYADVDVPRPTAQYQCLLFSRTPGSCPLTDPGDRPYSVTSYYEELSHHRISMDGVVFAKVREDSVAAYYTNGCNGIGVVSTCPGGRNRMGLMLVATLDSVSARSGGDTLWSQFDNDGTDGVPNSGDDDGVVDFVTFLQPELGGECQSNTPKPTGIWSHRYVISGWVQGLVHPHLDPGGFYVTRTPWTGHAGQFLKVNDYTIQSAIGGITSCESDKIMGIGTVAHETGHAFGLPDLYDVSGSTQGIGGWGLMGSGNYARPYSPSSYDAWSLHVLGWTTLDTLSASRTVTTGPRLFTDTIFYARTANPDEYLLVENRQAVLSDTAQMNPALTAVCPNQGFCAKSPGLLLWLINQPKVTSSLFGNSVNVSFGGLQGVELIQADGLNELRTPGSHNRGDRGDSYPGNTNNTRFSLLANPSARDNAGNYIGFVLDQIQQLPAGAMRFRFLRRGPTLIQAAGGAIVRVNGDAWSRYEEVVAGGDPIQLSVDDVQLLASGKTRARFLAWSQGGPRDQTVISSPTRPDTLSASFALEHRLLVITPGGGTVNSSVSGSLSQGIFLPEGTAVTLTAVAPAGTIFTGWRGDTVATAPVLQVTLRKGYDLEARFVTEVNVIATDAVSDLLGAPKLNDAQRTYLDELGNRNGIYDVGDLLAMYRRMGQAVPAALLRTPLRERRP
ncbi:MAG TPA: M6 family metalloprotease domain-containing protein [Gemmatimonadales bacterium]|nr:M6 family metalloprotease domain-containing protein [Gemmatimonadales bacterium]